MGTLIRISTAVLILVASGACERQQPAPAARGVDNTSAQAAYQLVLDSVIRRVGPRHAVLDHPIKPRMGDDTVPAVRDLAWLSGAMPGLDRATVDAFVARQSRPAVATWRSIVGETSPVELLDSARVWAMLDSVRWGPSSVERQAVGLSVAGFNPNGTQGLVYAGYYCGPLCGGEFYVFVVRPPGGAWRVRQVYRTVSS